MPYMSLAGCTAPANVAIQNGFMVLTGLPVYTDSTRSLHTGVFTPDCLW